MNNFGKTYNFGVHVMLITGPETTISQYLTAYQADESYTPDIILPLLKIDVDDGGVRFALIRDLDNFLKPPRAAGNKHYRRFCRRCLDFFNGDLTRDKHEKTCRVRSTTALPGKPDFFAIEKMPQALDDGPPVRRFNAFKKQLHVPVVVCVDFEAQLQPNREPCAQCISDNTARSARCRCDKEDKPSFCESYETHKAVAYCYVVADCDGNVLHESHGVSSTGEAGSLFLDDLLHMEHKILQWARPKKPLVMTDQEYAYMPFEEECCICHVAFDHYDHFVGTLDSYPPGHERIVLHHDHFTSKFIGLAHSFCNLQVPDTVRIPLIGHNIMGYDACFFLRELVNHPKVYWREFLPKNTERLRGIKFNHFETFDSLFHLPTSLSHLSDLLSKDLYHDYKLLKQSTICKDEDGVYDWRRFNLLQIKLPFPYKAVTSVEALKNYEDIPPRSMFYSDLTDDYTISEEMHEKARHIFRQLRCSDMLDYMLTYMILDVYLTLEVVFRYRKQMSHLLDLDCMQYLSLPALALDGFLKKTNVSIELLQQRPTYHLVKDNLRGGLSWSLQRWAQKTDDTRLLYIDKNALYASCMTLPLPEKDYRWLTTKEIANLNIMNIDPFVDKAPSYLFLCDLDFPPEKCLDFSELMPAPLNMEINYDMLSPYTKNLMKKAEGQTTLKTSRLTATYGPRKDYLVHASMLKLYLSLGVKITKIHAVLSFHQSRYAKAFMDKARSARVNAGNDFENKCRKLLVNSIYGKFSQRLDKYMELKMVTRPELGEKWMRKPYFHSYKVLSENMLFVFLKRRHYTLDCMVLNAFQVLSHSKFSMYYDYYYVFKPLFPERKLLYMDTDSYIMDCGTVDIEERLSKVCRHFDFSNLPETHVLHDTSRKGFPFLWKIETLDNEILEIVCLRPKVYALRLATSHEGERMEKSMFRCKGIAKQAVTKFRFESYKEALFKGEKFYAKSCRIQASNFTLSTVETRKLALVATGIKRWTFGCGIHTAPYYSPEIQVFKGECRHCMEIPEEEQRQKLKTWIEEQKR